MFFKSSNTTNTLLLVSKAKCSLRSECECEMVCEMVCFYGFVERFPTVKLTLWRVACVWLVLVVDVSECSVNYCKLDRQHIMCKYPKTGVKKNCRMVPMTERRRHVITDRINFFRSGVACGISPNLPSATNMLLLTWDDKLQVIAERWAMQCDTTSRNNKCAVKQGETCKMSMGQSTESYYLDEMAIIDQWFDQTQNMKNDGFQKYKDESATQDAVHMLYDKATRVGCGLVDPNKEKSKAVLFCAFAPAHSDGQPVFDAGRTTSKCRRQYFFHDKYHGLCADHSNDTSAPLPAAPAPLQLIATAAAAASLAGSEKGLAATTALVAMAVLPTQALAALTVLVATALAGRAICRCRKEPLLSSAPPPQSSAGERKGKTRKKK